MRRHLTISAPLLALALALALTRAPSAGAAPVANERCPVEPTELAVERYQTTYRGAAVSFCCAECIKEFDRSPESYLDQLGSMHFDAPPTERSPLQKAFDAVWNAGARTAGLTIGAVVLLGALITRLILSKIAADGSAAKVARAATGVRGVTTIAALSLGGEALSSHLAHRRTLAEIAEAELEHDIHYTVYQEYGDPPIPSRPRREPSVASVFYRGNDERNPALFNGGHYRTTTFHLDLCDAGGAPVAHGDLCDPAVLFLRARFERAPGTPDFFWKPENMDLIYATSDPGRFHGRFEPLGDAVKMDVVEPMQKWEFRYPLARFVKTHPARVVRGLVYQCERRFGDDGETVVGGRFHYAYQFELHFEDGALTAQSDLWMGALYRKRSLRIWEIPESQWLSIAPIPLIEGGQITSDPKLLGIEAYQKDTN